MKEKREPDPLADPARWADYLAGLIEREHLTPGEVAELRRADAPEPSSGGTFWKVVALYLEPHGHLRERDAARSMRELRRWQVTVRTVAELHGSHRRGRRLGEALAEAGVSEMRLLRLLRAEGERLSDTLRAVSHQLASSGATVDLGDVARLVFSGERDHGIHVRRRIARDFYRALYRQQAPEASPAA